MGRETVKQHRMLGCQRALQLRKLGRDNRLANAGIGGEQRLRLGIVLRGRIKSVNEGIPVLRDEQVEWNDNARKCNGLRGVLRRGCRCIIRPRHISRGQRACG